MLLSMHLVTCPHSHTESKTFPSPWHLLQTKWLSGLQFLLSIRSSSFLGTLDVMCENYRSLESLSPLKIKTRLQRVRREHQRGISGYHHAAGPPLSAPAETGKEKSAWWERGLPDKLAKPTGNPFGCGSARLYCKVKLIQSLFAAGLEVCFLT